MKYRRLGKTGLDVSVIGIGTWQFGGEWGKTFQQEEVDALFRRGEELGINLLDTAECYGDHLSEKLIGGALVGKRDKWIIATKFGHKYNGFMDRSEPRRPQDVIDQVEDSLKALRTDYVDLLQYHSWSDEDFTREEVAEVLRKLVAAGKVRHIGNSIGGGLSVRQAELSEEFGVAVLQVIYNRLDRRPEEKVFALATKMNLGVLARVPLASGFLSGKYKPGATFPVGDIRHERKQEDINAKLREVAKIRAEEVPPGVEMGQWALAWCLKNPAVSAVIPGCKDVTQVERNAAAAELVE